VLYGVCIIYELAAPLMRERRHHLASPPPRSARERACRIGIGRSVVERNESRVSKSPLASVGPRK
jgi:hypothetical protein